MIMIHLGSEKKMQKAENNLLPFKIFVTSKPKQYSIFLFFYFAMKRFGIEKKSKISSKSKMLHC